jgi:hypothetical protein
MFSKPAFGAPSASLRKSHADRQHRAPEQQRRDEVHPVRGRPRRVLKGSPTQLRFFEIYADEAAYKSHIASPHFRKYFEITKHMIVPRKLIETVPVQLSTRKESTAGSHRRPARYLRENSLPDFHSGRFSRSAIKDPAIINHLASSTAPV